MWLEEAYEISKESDFDMLDESIRGQVPKGYFKQITLSLNPWSDRHFIKKRFFDTKSPDILAITTNYKCNEFLDEADRSYFEQMKERNPRRYRVAGLGEWGVTEGLVFENWKEQDFDVDYILSQKGIREVYGLDWGYSHDPTALFCGLVDRQNKRLYVFDEMYRVGLSNERIAESIKELEKNKKTIRADSSEPKSIARLQELGLFGVKAARKGADSIRHGIDALQDYEIIIHPRCVNFITGQVWSVYRQAS